jgi:hypothetical protein
MRCFSIKVKLEISLVIEDIHIQIPSTAPPLKWLCSCSFGFHDLKLLWIRIRFLFYDLVCASLCRSIQVFHILSSIMFVQIQFMIWYFRRFAGRFLGDWSRLVIDIAPPLSRRRWLLVVLWVSKTRPFTFVCCYCY